MSQDLKPCPFCGCDRIYERGFRCFECPECGAEGPTKGTRAEAMNAWNTRAEGAPAAEGASLIAAVKTAKNAFRMLEETAVAEGKADAARNFIWLGEIMGRALSPPAAERVRPKRGDIRTVNGRRERFIESDDRGDVWEILPALSPPAAEGADEAPPSAASGCTCHPDFTSQGSPLEGPCEHCSTPAAEGKEGLDRRTINALYAIAFENRQNASAAANIERWDHVIGWLANIFDAALSPPAAEGKEDTCGILPPRHDPLCVSASPCLLPDGHDGPHACETRDGRRSWQSDDDCDCCDVTDPDRCITWSPAPAAEPVAWRGRPGRNHPWKHTGDAIQAEQWAKGGYEVRWLYDRPQQPVAISREEIERVVRVLSNSEISEPTRIVDARDGLIAILSKLSGRAS